MDQTSHTIGVDQVELNEGDVILQILKGDSNKFEVLYFKYEKQIFSYVYGMVNHHPQETEDICSEIWIKAFNKLDRFNRKKSFFSWVYTIARNTCFDHLRKRKNTLVSVDTIDAHLSGATITIEEKVFQKQTIHTIFNKLTLKNKNLLLLRYIEGYQPREIAEILDIPTNRVSVQINRALAQAKKYF